MPSGTYKRINNPVSNLKGGWKGKKRPPFSETHRKNMGIASKGRHPIKEFQKGNKKSEKAYRFPCGENHPNWQGGISNNPYPKEFNKQLKLKIRQRDNFICCLCGKTEREELEDFNRVLCVNHIDFNKTNCSEKNLNSLCSKCNTKINRERDYWTNYFQIK